MWRTRVRVYHLGAKVRNGPKKPGTKFFTTIDKSTALPSFGNAVQRYGKVQKNQRTLFCRHPFLLIISLVGSILKSCLLKRERKVLNYKADFLTLPKDKLRHQKGRFPLPAYWGYGIGNKIAWKAKILPAKLQKRIGSDKGMWFFMSFVIGEQVESSEGLTLWWCKNSCNSKV